MKNNLFKWVVGLSLFGITLAVYLLWQQLATPAFKPCSINETVNCDAVISGPVAYTFGVRTPLIGLIGYIVILILAVMKKGKMVLGMSAFGLAFCLYIAFIELVQLNVICPVCIMCQLTMITIFIMGIKLSKSNSQEVTSDDADKSSSTSN